MIHIDLVKLLEVSLAAGKEIMEVYEKDFEVETKADDSPLTIADQRSHQVIKERLETEYPSIPLLSEEGGDIPYTDRHNWELFWLVDPLDGTKEFIKRNGEFTVNIALIENGYPVAGVIYMPVLDTFYYGKVDVGAYKLEQALEQTINNEQDLIEQSTSLPSTSDSEIIKVVASRSHMSEDTQVFIDRLSKDEGKVDVVSAGSSAKFCLIAEGQADYYPRFAPTMEWDTGAGQAIVEAAGGKVLNYEKGDRLYYNREDLKNGWFIAQSRKSLLK